MLGREAAVFRSRTKDFSESLGLRGCRERSSRKSVSFEEQLMSKSNFARIFSCILSFKSMLENMAFFPTKREKKVGGGGGSELSWCLNSFFWDCSLFYRGLRIKVK